MTRVQKIEALLKKSINIEYHFGYYTKQRRLIIDQVEEFKYNMSNEDQKLAREHVDLLYWEYTRD